MEQAVKNFLEERALRWLAHYYHLNEIRYLLESGVEPLSFGQADDEGFHSRRAFGVSALQDVRPARQVGLHYQNRFVPKLALPVKRLC